MVKGKRYLEENLVPLIESINVIETNSFIWKALGLGHLNSQSSVQIQIGDRLEKFWNKVISDCTTNLIAESNYIFVGGKRRQIDHMFIANKKVFYLESKCNLEFDTEKKPASNEKIKSIAETVKKKYNKEVVSGYFVPVLAQIPKEIQKKYSDVNIYGVDWMLETLKCELFTSSEFFSFFENRLGPIVIDKLGLPTEE